MKTLGPCLDAEHRYVAPPLGASISGMSDPYCPGLYSQKEVQGSGRLTRLPPALWATLPAILRGTRKHCPCKFPGQLGHRAFGSWAQRNHRGLPVRMEKYHVPWQGLLGPHQRPTGGGWHQPLLGGSRGSHGKVERMALRGLSSEQQNLQNKGVFPKRRMRWCD